MLAGNPATVFNFVPYPGGPPGDVDLYLKPDVFAHNVECVRRLQRTVRDVRSSYDLSLTVLRRAKERSAAAVASGKKRLTKSSIMVGLGETSEEVSALLRDLRRSAVRNWSCNASEAVHQLARSMSAASKFGGEDPQAAVE